MNYSNTNLRKLWLMVQCLVLGAYMDAEKYLNETESWSYEEKYLLWETVSYENADVLRCLNFAKRLIGFLFAWNILPMYISGIYAPYYIKDADISIHRQIEFNCQLLECEAEDYLEEIIHANDDELDDSEVVLDGVTEKTATWAKSFLEELNAVKGFWFWHCILHSYAIFFNEKYHILEVPKPKELS